MESDDHVWHREVISEGMERVLQDFQGLGVLDQCYLAGGTGLALRLGHRRSQDLDFFSRDPVEPEAMIRKMRTIVGFSLVSQAKETLYVTVEGVKISFFGYYDPVLFPFEALLSVNVADPRDIACMKLSAIAGRGTKRDFVDFYIVAKQYGLPQLLEWFKQKYAQTNYSLLHVLKSLTYFEDAEKEPMPDMLKLLDWEEVTRFFSREAPRLSP